MPQPKVPPVSAVTTPAMSCARSVSSAAAAWSSSRRRPGGVCDQPANASPAASAAARASSRVAAGGGLRGVGRRGGRGREQLAAPAGRGLRPAGKRLAGGVGRGAGVLPRGGGGGPDGLAGVRIDLLDRLARAGGGPLPADEQRLLGSLGGGHARSPPVVCR